MKQILISSIYKGEQGKLGVSQCPGKNISRGRDGKPHHRSIMKDLSSFKERGVDLILCLLNDYELRTIGVNPSEYRDAAQHLAINLIFYPIIEMGVPNSIEEFYTIALLPVLEAIHNGQGVVIHCRGGIGRAGLTAACLLKDLGVCQTPSQAISTVRRLRDKRAVECRRQEEFVAQYYRH